MFLPAQAALRRSSLIFFSWTTALDTRNANCAKQQHNIRADKRLLHRRLYAERRGRQTAVCAQRNAYDAEGRKGQQNRLTMRD